MSVHFLDIMSVLIGTTNYYYRDFCMDGANVHVNISTTSLTLACILQTLDLSSEQYPVSGLQCRVYLDSLPLQEVETRVFSSLTNSLYPN